MVGHTFPSKELLLLHIAKEANCTGCWLLSRRSDDYRVQIHGCEGSSFCVRAAFSPSTGWKVTLAETRDNTLSQESKEDFENVLTEVDGDEVEEDQDDVDGVTGDANGVVSVAKKNRNRSPMKSCWIFPLIKEVIAKTPNISNREMKTILSDYIKVKFLSTSLL